MKTSMIIGAMASAAMAQSSLTGFDQLPACGQTCATNMLHLAESLGCTGGDLACLCLNQNFSYGIRDCTDQACPNSKDASDTQAWGVAICANNGVAITSVSNTVTVSTDSGATVSTAVTATPDVTSSATATITSDGSTLTTAVPSVSVSTGTASTTVSSGASHTTQSAKTTTTQSSSKNNSGDNSQSTTDTPDAAPRASVVPMGIMAVAGFAALML
jgi:hypothetical protein